MIGWIILGLLVLFLVIIITRALMFNPKKQPQAVVEEIPFDKERAVTSLQKLVQCKTISYNDPALEDDGEFQKLLNLLPNLYPNVFNLCEAMHLPNRALLLRWKGKHTDKPSVMMSH